MGFLCIRQPITSWTVLSAKRKFPKGQGVCSINVQHVISLCLKKTGSKSYENKSLYLKHYIKTLAIYQLDTFAELRRNSLKYKVFIVLINHIKVHGVQGLNIIKKFLYVKCRTRSRYYIS